MAGSEDQNPPTVFDWAGGEPAVRALIDAFYDRVERDQLLSPFFPGGVHEEHRDHVAAWWSEVLGGAEVAPHAPVPRWGWGEAPPFDG